MTQIDKNIRLLVIDDNDIDRKLIKSTFGKTKLRVKITEAKNAAEGLKAIKKGGFDCVLLDYHLPDKNGLQFLKEIANDANPEIPPIVICTENDDYELALKTQAAGAQGFIAKSRITPPELARTILGACERKKLITDNQKAQAEIQEKSEFLKAINNSVADGILVTDADCKIISANNSSLKTFGFKEEELVGQNITILMADENSHAFEKDITRYRETGKSDIIDGREMDVMGQRKNKETFPLEILISSGKIAGNQVFIASIWDVTNFKKTEADLKEVEKNYKILADNASDIIILHGKKGEISYVSPAAERHLGINPDEQIGKQTLGILHPDDGKVLMQNWDQKVYKEGEPLHIDLRFRNTEGEYLWFECHTDPVKDEGGKVIGAVTTARNITEYKHAESEALSLGRIIEDSLNEIYILDAKTLNFIMVNRGARENLGYTLEEMLNTPLNDISVGNAKSRFSERVKPLLNGEKDKLYYESVHRRKDGTHYDVEVYLQFTTRGTKPVYVAIVEDITEKKMADEKLRQAQKMEAVGNLSGGIAHDFNNLLTAIQGSLQLLEMVETDISGDARECLNIAIKSTKRGADLTHRLLAFSRKQTLKPKLVEVNDLVSGMIPMFRRTIDESIGIETNLFHRECYVKVDDAELENCLLNLTVNARDAMSEGGRIIFEVEEVDVKNSVAGDREIQPGKYVVLSVTDSGTGMSAEVRNQIFEPFFSTKGVEKGTGLGLSMVYGFVKQSGGHISVYSELGKGTTFKLFLKRTEGVKNTLEEKKKTRDLSTKESGTILLVEDDEGVMKFITRALKAKGYKVLAVEDGPSAVLVMKEERDIDLLLSDVVLPKGMTGADVGKEFEMVFPGKPIIYSSGYTGRAIKKEGWLKEGEQLLSKPYDIDVLFDMIRDKLTHSKAH